MGAIFALDSQRCATVDYLARKVVSSETDPFSHETRTGEYPIPPSEFSSLLETSEIGRIRAFEQLPEGCRGIAAGYRDGWRLEYSYFTMGDPPRTDGYLGDVYEGNPVEGIVRWLDRCFPDLGVQGRPTARPECPSADRALLSVMA